MNWNYDMNKAPTDGSLLLLLIAPEGRDFPLDDTQESSRTIGFNNKDNDEEDVWQFAGWCWEHDHFVCGQGKPIAWMPYPEIKKGN